MGNDDQYSSLKKKFREEVEKGMKSVRTEKDLTPIRSKDYQQFRETYMPVHQSLYEQACNFTEGIIKLNPGAEKEAELRKAIETAHLQVTPAGVHSFALLFPFAFIFAASAIAMVLTGSLFLVFFFLIFGGLGILLFMQLPFFFADNWRMKGSNQMILAVFYIVTYMRHTSNFERAVEFASDHLQPPMSLDLKKVLWDVETGKYSTIFASMEAYLSTWRKYNDEFIESMHLIQGSLLEESEERRVAALDKSLDVILDQTYEKMLHYAHNLQSPITTLHMLGIILPILGLVILPLMVSFMDNVQWYHIASIYNIALPVIVYVMGSNILSKRPTGYGATDIMDKKEKEDRSFWNNPLYLSIACFVIIFVIGLAPLWLHWIGVPDFGFGSEMDPEISSCGKSHCFFDYHVNTDAESPNAGEISGPFGLGAAVLGLCIPLAFSMAFALYFGMRTRNVLELRNKAKDLENEFSQAIFTLGNRLGDGFPVEMACGKVAETMPDTDSGRFFMLMSYNIQRLGMNLEEAIFDKKYGAITSYPSPLIESSMKVLVESSKKGPHIASGALMNISRYLNEMHKVNERLQDLMAEVISSMKSQINFLTPIIAGIVIGITSMISTILARLSGTLGKLSADADTGGMGVGGGLLNMFGEGIPTYFFQIIIGLYVVQLVFILTIMVNGIENGVDPVMQRYLLAKNMLKSVGLYLLVSLSVMLLFNFIAGSILSGIAG